MRSLHGLGRGMAGKTGGEIAAIEGIAGAGGVDRGGDMHRRNRLQFSILGDQCRLLAILDHDFTDQLSQPFGGHMRFGIAEQHLLVWKGRQRDVGDGKRFEDRRLRVLAAVPQARPVVGIEGDKRTCLLYTSDAADE